MLQKCTYNSQYTRNIAHYAQVELTTMLTKTDMRHEETQLPYQGAAISILHVFRFKKWVNQPFTSP